jgi:hypothetical protein
MNKWVKKSIKLSKSNFYLDNLLEIYPPEEIARELIVEEEAPNLKKLFNEKNRREILKELIRLKSRGFKFPIENPYISFLSHYVAAIDKNPKLVNIITNELFKMNYVKLKKKLEAPKKASRRIGPMFRAWLKKKFKFVNQEKFKKDNGLMFLSGNDEQLKEYAMKQLKCKLGELSKGLDFVGKIRQKYIIGTAKFITDFGGSQSNQFYEAIRFIKETKSPQDIIVVAIVDGVAWLEGTSKKGRKMQNILKNLKNDEFCLSALFLQEFLKEITLAYPQNKPKPNKKSKN